MGRLVSVDTDEYPARAELELDNDVFIRVHSGVHTDLPL